MPEKNMLKTVGKVDAKLTDILQFILIDTNLISIRSSGALGDNLLGHNLHSKMQYGFSISQLDQRSSDASNTRISERIIFQPIDKFAAS